MTFKQALTKHMNAVMERNIEDFNSTIHTNSITLILGNGKFIQNREEFIRFHEDWFADLDWSITYEVVKTVETASLSTAILRIHYEDLDENKNPYEFDYYLQLVFENVNGNWLLVLDQNTNIK
jgi:hypothetical protein